MKLEKQKQAMEKAKQELGLQQQQRQETLDRERERQATREWWSGPRASSTITWAHSGGQRGVQAGGVMDWDTKVNLFIMANPGDGTKDLEEVDEAMDMSLEEITVLKGDQDHLIEVEDLQEEAKGQATHTMENKWGKSGH